MDDSFLYADFAAACVLVSFCVLMGKLTLLQIIILTIIEVKEILNMNKILFFREVFESDPSKNHGEKGVWLGKCPQGKI